MPSRNNVETMFVQHKQLIMRLTHLLITAILLLAVPTEKVLALEEGARSSLEMVPRNEEEITYKSGNKKRVRRSDGVPITVTNLRFKVGRILKPRPDGSSAAKLPSSSSSHPVSKILLFSPQGQPALDPQSADSRLSMASLSTDRILLLQSTTKTRSPSSRTRIMVATSR
jgi:hypothetical protein